MLSPLLSIFCPSSRFDHFVPQPLYAFPAIGELFVSVTAFEVAYTRAPQRMKGLVYALVLFSSALSSALVLIISPSFKDPNLIWVSCIQFTPYYPQTALTGLCAPAVRWNRSSQLHLHAVALVLLRSLR